MYAFFLNIHIIRMEFEYVMCLIFIAIRRSGRTSKERSERKIPHGRMDRQVEGDSENSHGTKRFDITEGI